MKRIQEQPIIGRSMRGVERLNKDGSLSDRGKKTVKRKKGEVHFFAISNSELAPKEQAGKKAPCPKCHRKHIIKYGKDENGEETTLLGFVDCEDKTYLVSVAGKLLLS